MAQKGKNGRPVYHAESRQGLGPSVKGQKFNQMVNYNAGSEGRAERKLELLSRVRQATQQP